MERVTFSPILSACLSGIQWPLLAYIDTHVAVFSGCSSLAGLMGPMMHTKYLSQAVGDIVHARWVRNGLWRESFLARKRTCLRLRGVQRRIVCIQCHPNGQVRNGSNAVTGGVLVGLKSPCLRAVQRLILGIQCHSSGCNFWLE